MKKEKIYRQNDMECRRYMADIRDIREIEGEEWEQLLDALMHGDSAAVAQARQRLITGCLPIVARLAARYDYLEGQGVKRIDLIGGGNLVLAEVVTRLAENPGVALEAYLVTWIKKGIQQARDRYLGYMPLHMVTDSEDEEDDAGFGDAVKAQAGRCRSLDDTLDEDSVTTLADTIDDDAATDAEVIRASARDELRRLLDRWLCPEEAGVLYDTCLCACPIGLRECMQKYGLTLKQLRHVRESAFGRLQQDDRRQRVAALLRDIR